MRLQLSAHGRRHIGGNRKKAPAEAGLPCLLRSCRRFRDLAAVLTLPAPAVIQTTWPDLRVVNATANLAHHLARQGIHEPHYLSTHDSLLSDWLKGAGDDTFRARLPLIMCAQAAIGVVRLKAGTRLRVLRHASWRRRL